MSALDKLPVATLTFLAGLVVIIIGMLNGELGVSEALHDLGYVGVGAGVLGHARNGAGRGMKRP